MRCEDILPLIEKLADGECSVEEKKHAEAHLAACGACRQHYEFVKALPAAARQVPLAEPPGAYWEVLPRKVMARIEREKISKRERGWLPAWFAPAQLRWLGVVAAGVIVVVLSYEVMRQTEPPSAPEPVRQAPRPSEKSAPVASEDAAAVDEEKARPTDVAEEEGRAEPSPAPRAPETPPAKPQAVEVHKREPSPAGDAFAAPGQPEREAPEESAPAAELREAGAREPGRGQAPEPAEAPTVAVAAEEPSARAKAVVSADKTEALEGIATLERSQRAARPATLGVASQVPETELEARCRVLRESVGRSPEGEELVELRYRLARCSIQLFKMSPTEERRTRAIEDAEAFLDGSPESGRADQIREELDSIKNRE